VSALLPQPGGFEGFGFLMGEEELNPLHKAVIVQRPDGVADGIYLDPATGASARHVCAFEDLVALNPEIEQLKAFCSSRASGSIHSRSAATPLIDDWPPWRTSSKSGRTS
jgi:hypothetical protein